MQFQFLPRLCHGHSDERHAVGNFGACPYCAEGQGYRRQALPQFLVDRLNACRVRLPLFVLVRRFRDPPVGFEIRARSCGHKIQVHSDEPCSVRDRRLPNSENVTNRSIRPHGAESRSIDFVPACRCFELALDDRDVVGMKPRKPIVFAKLLWRVCVETCCDLNSHSASLRHRFSVMQLS